MIPSNPIHAVGAGVLVAIAITAFIGALVLGALVWFSEPAIGSRPAATDEPSEDPAAADTAVLSTPQYQPRHRAGKGRPRR